MRDISGIFGFFYSQLAMSFNGERRDRHDKSPGINQLLAARDIHSLLGDVSFAAQFLGPVSFSFSKHTVNNTYCIVHNQQRLIIVASEPYLMQEVQRCSI